MGAGEVIEKAVIDILTKDIGAAVKYYPENPNNYQPDAYPCEVLVRYGSSSFSQEDVSASMVIVQRMVEITVVGQSLRGEGAIYDTLSQVTTALQGTSIEGLGTFKITSEKFSDEYQGVWQYTQQYTFNQNLMYGKHDEYSEDPPTWSEE